VIPVRLLRMPTSALAACRAAAVAAFPDEACALLEGEVFEGQANARALHLTGNVAADRRATFEVDPRALLRLHRETRARGSALIGVWHSHPNGVAVPSTTDFTQAYDPTLVWLLTPVTAMGAGPARAYGVGPHGFVEIGLEPA
jgi:proteasome lid subunit RPN8/RPN11